MKAVLALLFLLASLLTAESTLQCEQCFAQDKTCMGQMMNCSIGEDTCVIIATQNLIDGVKTMSVTKTCGVSSSCNQPPTLQNFGKALSVISSIHCCMGDACKNASALIPNKDTIPNGISCPACYAIDSSLCPKESVNCTGPETKCLDLAEQVTSASGKIQLIMKGCVTPNVCTNLQTGSMINQGTTIDITKVACTSGGAPGLSGLLPALAGLLMLKLLP